MALNPKQKLFVKHYLLTKSARAAAKAAGYSKRSAHSVGPRLLAHADVAAAINKVLEKQVEKLELSADRILTELNRIALVDLGKAFDENGKLLPIHEMPEDTRRAISGFEQEDLFLGRYTHKQKIGLTSKVKTFDKVRALEALGRHFKLFEDTSARASNGTLPVGADGAPYRPVVVLPAKKISG